MLSVIIMRWVFRQFGFKVLMDMPVITRKDSVCLALQVSGNEFYLIANGCMVAPFSANPKKPNVDVLSLEEGEIREGKWYMRRRLNGDEVASMRYDKPVLLKIKLFAYQQEYNELEISGDSGRLKQAEKIK